MKRLYWGFLLLPFIWNCATHVPMSEMVMFSPKKVEASYPDTIDQVYYSRLSVGPSVKQDIKSYNALRRHSDAKYQNGSIDELSYAPSVGFNTILMFTGNDYFALNFAAGYTLGMDLTFGVTETEYVTVGTSFLGGSQIIVQRRMHYNYKSGSALGVYLERYTEVLGYDCYSLCFGPPEESVIYLNSFGVRGLWMNHSGGKNRSFFKVNAKMGYILDYGSPYASVGISVGAY